MNARHDTGAHQAEHPSLVRIGAFSDAVFAFAITLLILAIRIPHPSDADADQGLLTLLTREWRSYLAFVLSFMLVGINWANHRVMFKTFARADHTLVWLNLLYLMVIAFTPVPTAVLGAWLGSLNNQVVAAVFYGAVATVGAVLYILLWWYGAYVAKLTSPELSARQRRAHTIAWAPAPFVVAILTLVAFVSPPVAVAGYLALVLVYVLPVPRLVAQWDRGRRARSGHSG
jgi:TMEM175 potassium channel family protein